MDLSFSSPKVGREKEAPKQEVSVERGLASREFGFYQIDAITNPTVFKMKSVKTDKEYNIPKIDVLRYIQSDDDNRLTHDQELTACHKATKSYDGYVQDIAKKMVVDRETRPNAVLSASLRDKEMAPHLTALSRASNAVTKILHDRQKPLERLARTTRDVAERDAIKERLQNLENSAFQIQYEIFKAREKVELGIIKTTDKVAYEVKSAQYAVKQYEKNAQQS